MSRARVLWLLLPASLLAGCLMSRLQISDGAAAGGASSGSAGENTAGKSGAGTGGDGGTDSNNNTSGDAGAPQSGGANGGNTSAGAANGGGVQGGASNGGTSGSPTGGTGNTAGSSAGSAGAPVTPLAPFGPPPEDKVATVEIGVRNNCPTPVWVHTIGGGVVLTPDDKQLMHGDIQWYDAPKSWSGALSFYGAAAHAKYLDRAQISLNPTNDTFIYSIVYVDGLGIPMELIGSGSGMDCKRVGCYVTAAQVASGCPSGLFDGSRCLSAGEYCKIAANAGIAVCTALAGEITKCTGKTGCQGASGESTSSAYNCSGFFTTNPKWCAALNRGMVDDPDSTDISKYYKSAPSNPYAKWVHGVCPGIYAFAYDDYPAGAEESGDHTCVGGKYVELTLCPTG